MDREEAGTDHPSHQLCNSEVMVPVLCPDSGIHHRLVLLYSRRVGVTLLYLLRRHRLIVSSLAPEEELLDMLRGVL